MSLHSVLINSSTSTGVDEISNEIEFFHAFSEREPARKLSRNALYTMQNNLRESRNGVHKVNRISFIMHQNAAIALQYRREAECNDGSSCGDDGGG